MHPKRVLQVCDRFFHFHFSLHYDMRWLTLVSLALTLSWRRPLSYRNQSNDLQSNNDLRHERVKRKLKGKEYLPNHLLFLRIIILILLWILTEKNYFQKQPSGGVLWKIFTGKHLCWSLFLIKLQETPTQVFSCEYCKIFKNNVLEEHLQTAASVFCKTYTPLVATFTTNNTHITILYCCNCFYQKFTRFLTLN